MEATYPIKTSQDGYKSLQQATQAQIDALKQSGHKVKVMQAATVPAKVYSIDANMFAEEWNSLTPAKAVEYAIQRAQDQELYERERKA